MRRPVRMITLPSTSSRRMRFGAPPGRDGVRRPDVVLALGRDRGRLEPEAGLTHRAGGLVDAGVVRRAPVFEREVVALELDLALDHLRSEHPQRLLEQLLAGLVALQHDDRERVWHERRRRLSLAAPEVGFGCSAPPRAMTRSSAQGKWRSWDSAAIPPHHAVVSHPGSTRRPTSRP